MIRITKEILEESYSLFDASSLAIGDVVCLDIYIRRSSDYIIIIAAGTSITEKLHNLLKKQDNLYVIDKNGNVNVLNNDESAPFFEEDEKKIITHGSALFNYVRDNKSQLDKTLQLLYETNGNMFHDFLTNEENRIDLACAESIIKSIIFLVQKNKNYLKKIMPHLENDYRLPVHSLNVTLYALHIGYLLNFNKKELLKLGKAALLHDIGNKKISSIINKESELSPEELEQIQENPESSVSILKENNITDFIIVDAVREHHERYDGSGYPNHLLKNEITDFGSILAVCDVFDALTVDKPYRKGYATFDSLKIMLSDPTMKNKFNNEYIKLLLV